MKYQALRCIGSTTRTVGPAVCPNHGKFYTVIPNASEVAAEVAAVLQAADQEKSIFLFINFEDPIATSHYFAPDERKTVKDNYKNYLQESMKRIDDVLPLILFFFREGLIIVTSDHGQGDGTKFRVSEHGTSLHPFQTQIPLLIHNFKPKNLDENVPIDLTRIMDITLEYTGLEHPRKELLFRSDIPAAFAHHDSSPERKKAKWPSFGAYADQSYLILQEIFDGFIKEYYLKKTGEVGISELSQIEQCLSEIIYPFTDLRSVFTKTEKYYKLDEKNIEALKSLGYIE